MFNFRQRAPRNLTIRETLAQAGVPSAANPAGVGVVETNGSYSGRRVSFFRAFDPGRASARAVDVRSFKDLDAYPDLVLGAGHVEREGLVVLTSRIGVDQLTPTRSPADRTAHADDERFVFWTAPQTSATPQSDPAAIWLHAQAIPTQN